MKNSNFSSPFQQQHEDLLRRINDWSQQAQRQFRCITSPFLDEAEVTFSERVLQGRTDVAWDGGSLNARRKKLLFHPNGEFESDVVCLKAEFNPKFSKLEHRDVLGALMSLKIDRNNLGDLWVDDHQIVIYTHQKMKRYIIDQCKLIRRTPVSFEECEPIEMEEKLKPLQVNIASERLDSLVATLANCSREKAQQMLRQGKVQVNHETLEDCSRLCNNRDTISIRGVGRFRYDGVIKSTRKNRLICNVSQFV